MAHFQDMKEKVHLVFASLFTDRAISYRHDRGLSYRRSTFSASCFWCPQTLADGITALLFRITDFWLLVLLLGQDTSEFRAQPILLIIYLVSLKWRAHFLWQIPFHCYGHHKAVFWAGPSRFLELEWRDSRELMWLSLFQHRDSPVFHRRFYHFAPRRRISWFKLVGHLVILLVGFWCLKQHPDALASLSGERHIEPPWWIFQARHVNIISSCIGCYGIVSVHPFAQTWGP